MEKSKKSHSYFHKELGYKITYNDPIIIIPLVLNDTLRGGGNPSENLYSRILTHKVRFMYAVHKCFKHATLLLRQIFIDEDINFNNLKKWQKTINDQLIRSEKNLDMISKNKTLTIYNYSKESAEFLDLWKEFMAGLGYDIIVDYSDIDFKKYKDDHLRYDEEINPLYLHTLSTPT